MSSCSPCPAMQTTGPERLKISLWRPPMENSLITSALVATAAQPWPRQTALASSPLGRSTIHSLLVSHDEKWRHWSLLRRGRSSVGRSKIINQNKNRWSCSSFYLASSSVPAQASSTASWERSAMVWPRELVRCMAWCTAVSWNSTSMALSCSSLYARTIPTEFHICDTTLFFNHLKLSVRMSRCSYNLTMQQNTH